MPPMQSFLSYAHCSACAKSMALSTDSAADGHPVRRLRRPTRRSPLGGPSGQPPPVPASLLSKQGDLTTARAKLGEAIQVARREEADGCIYQVAADQAHRYLRELAGEKVVPEIDLLRAFAENRDDGLFVDDYHPTEIGHSIAAIEMLEQLDAQAVLPR